MIAGPSAAELDVLGDQVFCDDELGLAWTEVDELPDEAVLLRANARNENVLRALAMLEEHDASQADAAERAELHRLEGKLDLALELLAELVRGRSDALALRPLRFNASGICWDGGGGHEGVSAPDDASDDAPDEAPRVGALLTVDCYVLPPWPVPIKLYCRVKGIDPRGRNEYRVCARLEGQTDAVNEWLGKLVFRRHRRSIAQQRQRGNDLATQRD